LKDYYKYIAIIATLFVIYMSLKPPDSSSDFSSFFYLPGDKILHVICYFFLTLIYYFSFYNFKKKIYFSSLISFILGFGLELLQIFKIFQRQFDFFDILSNTIGISLAILIIHKKYY
tara:strand:- start:121 stop:471 length:351 start_codon:yes stop_codon:yes gene_type:complete